MPDLDLHPAIDIVLVQAMRLEASYARFVGWKVVTVASGSRDSSGGRAVKLPNSIGYDVKLSHLKILKVVKAMKLPDSFDKDIMLLHLLICKVIKAIS